MKSKQLKYPLLLILTIVVTPLLSQENKFGLTIEYSPYYSKISNEIVNERYKVSHNALLRITYNTKGKILPSIGLGYFNTGVKTKSEIRDTSEIETIKIVHNYNYLHIPIGVKINLNKFYILPELGIGINIPNRVTQTIEYSNGETEKKTSFDRLILGGFNNISLPLSLSLGYDFSLANLSFSTGIKGHFGLNQLVKDVPRENHYFRVGVLLALNF